MNLPELLKNVEKVPFSQLDAVNFSQFLTRNAKRVDQYIANEWNGDTYVIFKWPHKVPELVVLP